MVVLCYRLSCLYWMLVSILPCLRWLSCFKLLFCIIDYHVFKDSTLHIYDISWFPHWMSCLERLPCLLWLSWFSGFSVLSTILSTQIVLFILTISFDFPTECLVYKDCPVCIHILGVSGCSVLSSILSTQIVLFILTISFVTPSECLV